MTKSELMGRTREFALCVMGMTDDLPGTAKGRVLTGQILRAATSVAAGYRAACRARSRADWIDKVGRVLEEIDESLCWIDLIEAGRLLPPERLADLKREAEELTAIFASIHITSKTNARTNHKS